MALDYAKPFLTIAEQVALIARRGMHVADADEAGHYLRHEGYYRLGSYLHPFRQVNPATGQWLDTYVPTARFSDVIRLYEYDKWLRIVMLSGLRAIEISVRVAIAHHLGARDIFAHENPRCLNGAFTTQESSRRGKTQYQAWLDKYHLLLARDDQEDIVRQFIAKYGQRIPIWVAIELWDFGLLTRFFGGMKFADQQSVSRHYGVEEPHLFASWLRSFNYVRNVCAHHSRLWNRNIVEQPRLVTKHPDPLLRHLTERGVKAPGSRVYATLALATFVLRRMNYRGSWGGDAVQLLEKFPSCESLSPGMMGIPNGWRAFPLWKLPERGPT
ncbi:MAG: Abi family protein [Puniceicoccales bacterium]|jgi:abortive infection bacteriophage resistance protein|nr:Abi family protein [Puniceicoccales bacterium]